MDEMNTDLKNGAGDCDLFGELVVLEFIDEGEISAKDRRFMDHHVATCPQCAAFEGALDQLEDPACDPLAGEMTDRVLAEHAANGKKSRSGSRIVVIAAICGIAAMVALALGGIIPLPFEGTMLFGDDDAMIARDGSRATTGQIINCVAMAALTFPTPQRSRITF